MKGFTLAAYLTRVNPLKDRSMSLTFHTQELNTEEKVSILNYLGSQGWLLFRDNEIKDEEVPQEDSDLEPKTQSQRIRACLFLLWRQNGEKGDFQEYYKMQTEKIINHLKEKLT